MALPSTRARNRVLTASAAKIGGDSTTGFSKRQSLSWQNRALEYLDMVPELNYASRFYSRMLKQLIIFPARRDADGTIRPVKDEVPVKTLDRIQDPAGGRAQILGNYGRLMFSTGEGGLLGVKLGGDDERWSFVWNDEVNVETDSAGNVREITHKPNGDGQGVKYGPSEAVLYKFWTPHPRRSGEADSPMRAALDIAEELIILTKAVLSTAVSRTTSGILLMPSEMAPPPMNADGDEDPMNDPFMSSFVQHLVAQKEQVGGAEAVAPFVVWGANEFLPAIRYLKIHDTQNDYAERDLRKEAVERLARGFDFPPEVLLGFGDTNHWSARQVLDDMWKSHGAPIAQQFCDDLNDSYLRPALREADYEGWESIVIGYDASQITIKPDRSDDADKAIDRIAIGFEGYRRMKNIPESDAPTDEERDFLLALRLRRPGSLPGDGRAQPTADPTEGPPPAGGEGDSGRRTRVVGSAREVGASEMALHRCREVAGNRIRNKAQGTLMSSQAKSVQSFAVAPFLGSTAVESLGVDARDLVHGGTETLRSLLISWGHSPARADGLCEMVELYAARTLFDENVSLPPAVEAKIAQMTETAVAA